MKAHVGFICMFLLYQAQCIVEQGLIKLRGERISGLARRLHKKDDLCFNVKSNTELAEG